MIFGWENTLGWLAFLSLLPLILLYIIRPKPKEVDVPSLMFFMRSKTHHEKRSFFQQLSSDWLFLVQLLIFLLISLLFIEPYTTLGGNFFSDHTILIVDVSASTQVHNGQVFQNIIDQSKDHLSRTNTVILITNTPRTGIKEVSKKEASRYLDSLQPTDGRSSIGEAILLAEKYVKGEKDRVFVISDFLTTSTTDIAIVKNTFASKGISLQFIPIQTQNPVSNIGIVDLLVSSQESSVTVKNYNSVAELVPLSIGDATEELRLEPYEMLTHRFPTPLQPTEIELLIEDDFPPDNSAYLTLPLEKKIKVLLISDEPSFYLETALTSAEYIQLDIVGSGSFREDYDVYIIGKVRELPGTLLSKLQERVDAGASVIIRAEDNSLQLSYGDLLPLQLQNIQGRSLITVQQATKFTQDIAFGSVDEYYATTNPEGITLATAADNVLLLLKPVGQGNILYYGILEHASNFQLSPSYPIFWTNVVRYLAHVESIEDVNVFTGSILPLPTTTDVVMPKGTFTTDLIIFEDRGLYSVGDKTYAASLVSELESNLAPKEILAQDILSEQESSSEKGSFIYPLTTLLVILLCIFFFIELFLTRLRGEF